MRESCTYQDGLICNNKNLKIRGRLCPLMVEYQHLCKRYDPANITNISEDECKELISDMDYDYDRFNCDITFKGNIKGMSLTIDWFYVEGDFIKFEQVNEGRTYIAKDSILGFVLTRSKKTSDGIDKTEGTE